MTSSQSAASDALAPLSMIERINSQAPVTYANTAFTGQFDSEPARHKAGWANDIFENNTRCHEYPALLVASEVGMLREWKKKYNDPMTEGDAIYEKRKEEIHGTALPGGLHYTGAEFSLVSWLETIRSVALIGSLVGVATPVVGFLGFGMMGLNLMIENPVQTLLPTVVPVSTYYGLNWLIKTGVPARYSRPALPYISFRRDLGEVHIRLRRKIIKVPFSELQAGAITTFDIQTKLKKLAFGVKHKHSKLSVAMEGNLTATTPEGRWALCLRWELLQHYMDTTRPLPDIPMLEPYRHLDPTTRAWDEKHQRPRWVWMTMSDEDYLEIMSDAADAAETYPFSAPGHEPDPNDRKRWQPAGDGQHWYQLG